MAYAEPFCYVRGGARLPMDIAVVQPQASKSKRRSCHRL